MSTLKATWWLIPIAIGTLPLSYRAIEDLQKMPPPGHVNAQGDLVVNPDSYRDSTAELPGKSQKNMSRRPGQSKISRKCHRPGMSTLKATWWLIPIAIGTLPLSYRHSRNQEVHNSLRFHGSRNGNPSISEALRTRHSRNQEVHNSLRFHGSRNGNPSISEALGLPIAAT